MGPIDLVVAVRDNHESPHRVEPARQQADRIERRLVGPMQVLKHQDGRRPCAEVVSERRDHGARRGTLVEDGGEPPARLSRDVEQRTEWPRGVQRIAGAPENARSFALRAELPQERGLANPGLAREQDEPSTRPRPRRLDAAPQRLQLGGALEQSGGVAAHRPKSRTGGRTRARDAIWPAKD